MDTATLQERVRDVGVFAREPRAQAAPRQGRANKQIGFTDALSCCTLDLYTRCPPAMSEVNITELRQNLPTYIEQVRKGGELRVTVRGKVVARIVPEVDQQEAARRWLKELRKSGRVYVGDVVTPSEEEWDGERGDP